MTPPNPLLARLQFLIRTASKESHHVDTSDQRVFTQALSLEKIQQLNNDVELAERIEAFSSRFCRFQDTLGDKLLPALLRMSGEIPGVAIDNLDKAEKLGWLASVDNWMSIRQLRNQMVHEYIEDPAIFHRALISAHSHLPLLLNFFQAMKNEAARHHWLEAPTN